VSIGRNNRTSLYTRKLSLVGAGALVASLALAPAPSVADPDGDRPTIAEVERRLSDLQHRAEVASEELNAARVALDDARKQLRTLTGDLKRSRDHVEQLRASVVGTEVAEHQSASTLSSATTFLLTEDPAEFMDEVATSEILQDQDAALLAELVRQQKQLAVQEEQAESQVDAVKDQKAELAEHQDALDSRIAEAADLLDELEAEQRERLLARQARAAEQAEESQPSRSSTTVRVSDVPASDRAQVAVETALAQVGDPYVYGATGPDAFDCSGLTMYAWAAAGVSLPHASSAQPGAGTPVSISELMPGDLVFYYSPISHVGMYIGNGQIVHAANPSVPVQVVPLNYMPINSAVRVG
jgi:cell wall-associated NlpC family hydrolase